LSLLLDLEHLLIVVELCRRHPKMRVYFFPVVLFFMHDLAHPLFLVAHSLEQQLILSHQLLEVKHLLGFIFIFFCSCQELCFIYRFTALHCGHVSPLLVLLICQQLLQLHGQLLVILFGQFALPCKPCDDRLDVQVVLIVEGLFVGVVDDIFVTV